MTEFESELIPQAIGEKLPPIGSDPDTPLAETLIHLRLVDPASCWSWYVMEYDGEGTCFGIIVSKRAAVAGQFTLNELESISRGGAGFASEPIERDLSFEPVKVGALARELPVLGDLLKVPSPRELNLAKELVQLEGTE